MSHSQTHSMPPDARYRQDVAQGILFEDSAQADAIVHFQRLYDDLLARQTAESARFGWIKRSLNLDAIPPVKGLYIHGGVGRGKTYLMDVFFESLPFERKMRTHFHRFMQRVHAELQRVKRQKNPLESVARSIAGDARVLCFDEFFVSDIGDAMILGGLLAHLLEEGVVLVMTSNIEPASLYQNGLQRERFLPAIALLQENTDVIHLDGGIDYRLRSLQQASIYYSPLGSRAEKAMQDCFDRQVSEHARVATGSSVEVLGRQIPVRAQSDDVIWFDFADLCGGPRSAYDYVELGKLYHTVLVSDIPQLRSESDDMARRFVSLVDELYDRNAKLILSAQVELASLYAGSGLAFVFERTRSRLLEMQSEEYLGRQHRP